MLLAEYMLHCSSPSAAHTHTTKTKHSRCFVVGVRAFRTRKHKRRGTSEIMPGILQIKKQSRPGFTAPCMEWSCRERERLSQLFICCVGLYGQRAFIDLAASQSVSQRRWRPLLIKQRLVSKFDCRYSYGRQDIRIYLKCMACTFDSSSNKGIWWYRVHMLRRFAPLRWRLRISFASHPSDDGSQRIDWQICATTLGHHQPCVFWYLKQDIAHSGGYFWNANNPCWIMIDRSLAQRLWFEEIMCFYQSYKIEQFQLFNFHCYLSLPLGLTVNILQSIDAGRVIKYGWLQAAGCWRDFLSTARILSNFIAQWSSFCAAVEWRAALFTTAGLMPEY